MADSWPVPIRPVLAPGSAFKCQSPLGRSSSSYCVLDSILPLRTLLREGRPSPAPCNCRASEVHQAPVPTQLVRTRQSAHSLPFIPGLMEQARPQQVQVPLGPWRLRKAKSAAKSACFIEPKFSSQHSHQVSHSLLSLQL